MVYQMGRCVQCRLNQRGSMRYFLCVIGMVMIVEGLPYFARPDKMKSWLRKMLETPDGELRKIGAVVMTVGLLLVYLGRS